MKRGTMPGMMREWMEAIAAAAANTPRLSIGSHLVAVSTLLTVLTVVTVSTVLTVSTILTMTGCAAGPSGEQTRFLFRDVTARSGIDYRHMTGKSGRKFMVETFAGGVCLIDIDLDGRPDVYFVNGADLPGFKSDRQPRNRLYRNEGDFRFRDVTDAAGVGDGSYGMGCTAGDYDNDGDRDLYVTNFGPNVLYRNNGNGTFTDVTDAAGVGDPLWGSSTAFADFDGDGFLDLFVANYLDYTIERHKFCGNYRRAYQSYCPDAYDPASDVLYRNRGDGTFEDVSDRAGMSHDNGKGLGAVWGDYDQDGDVDLYVANDITPNFLYRNDGGGRFTDVALEAGVAYSESGDVQAGMGTDFGDFDNDGDVDIFVTNFDSETNSLYRNNGDGSFSDLSFFSGLGEISLRFLGFGTDLADLDNDGDLDVFINNGHILDDIEEHHDIITYAEPNLLFENLGDGNFREVGRGAGEVFLERRVGRGAATGDLDNDGDLDIVLVNIDDEAQVYENLTPSGHWISLSLIGRTSNRDGVGAWIEIEAGGDRQVGEARTASSYCSQNDMRIHFGIGKHRRVDRLEIRWPRGQVDRFRDIPADSFLTIEEGTGTFETTSRDQQTRREGA